MDNWIKKGLIYVPDGKLSWSKTHAQVPVPDFIKEKNQLKIYFSTRDEEGRSRPGYIIVDADDPCRIIEIADKPVIGLGKLGTFDDCGVMPSWIVDRGAEKFMYYIGWNVRNTIPYHNSIGLAVSHDKGLTWQKKSEGPVIERTFLEPYFNGTSCVLVENGVWKNWYLSCTEWRMIEGKAEPRYHIKYAESKDGINWDRRGIVAIDYLDDNEAGLVKASVIHENGIYKMWFAFRKFAGYRTDKNASYHIGYAESGDGIKWTRKNNEGVLPLAETGWDSLMTAYPHVIDVNGRRLMFYNGNGFGKSGFGYAELEK